MPVKRYPGNVKRPSPVWFDSKGRLFSQKSGASLVITSSALPAIYTKELRYLRREVSSNLPHVGKNPPKCGKTRRWPRIELVQNGKSAWFRGLVNCGQVWACPVCAYRVASHRGQELQRIIEAHRKTGGGICLVTGTLPHDQGDELKRLRRTVSKVWSKCISGRSWVREKNRIGYIGYVRALEVTVGPNGWHPHIHALIFTKKVLVKEEIEKLEFFLFAKWSFYVWEAGYRKPDRRYGLLISEGQDAGYYITKIVKQGLAAEIVQGVLKNSRNDSRSILDVLDDYHSDPTERDKKILVVWIRAMYGARQLTWGGTIRSRFKDLPVLSDEGVVELDEGKGKTVVRFEPELWDTYFKPHLSFRWSLISALERDGPQAVFKIISQILPPEKFKNFVRFNDRLGQAESFRVDRRILESRV